MDDAARRAVAIVGVGAILPDAPDARTFWENVKNGRYSIRDVPPERWDPALYYDPDPAAPDKTYSKLGAWVREWEWEPMRWHLPVPPRVSDAMDEGQKWAVAASRAALLDFGHPERALDLERTAVVIGNAMAGEHHYLTSLRIHFPRVAHLLGESPAFAALSPQQRETIARELGERMAADLPEVTEDTMPGELANVMAGRVANLFDLHGPNYTCDAACAAALAAIDAAVDGLIEEQFDAVLAGGVDRNMGPEPFVKFSKIGALSATGTRPYADGADGFVMGEGAIFFVLKRLVDAERAGDRVYAVLRGIAGSSDGRGKGITAPNPVGQRLSIERAWRRAGVPKASVGLIEGHGTSTRVGDVVEADSLSAVFADCGLAPGSVPLGSVKSNIGHLKGAAGAAGLLKAVFALDEKLLPPSLHFDSPNPNIDFAHSPFFVNTELKPWDKPPQGVRRAGVSAFGFGGTNFHAVLEEHVPGSLTRSRSSVAVPAGAGDGGAQLLATPLRGALVLGAASVGELRGRLERVAAEAAKGTAPPPQAPAESDLRAAERIAIDYGDAAELARRAGRALEALGRDEPAMWRVLRAQGVFRGSGDAPGVAFLYTGQGSQYANMLRGLRESEPVVAEVFADADRVMQPILGRPLTDFLFPDPGDAEAVKAAEESLRRTEITQPAVLSVDVALTRLLARYGVTADFVMGHSLGEYGALVSSGALPFEDALEAVAARGHEMASLEVPDKGRMAAVMAPLETIERVVDGIEGEVVVANVNSTHQAVIGGATAAVEAAMQALFAEGVDVVPLPVSHAFHTSIVAPASEPLRRVLSRLRLAAPEVPLVGNVDGEFYPAGPDAVAKMIELLGAQVASPVQFVKGLETLYAAGARVFVEVGPKKALFGFAEDVLGGRGDAVALFTNHPKQGELVSFNQALCGLYAAGLGVGRAAEARAPVLAAEPAAAPASLSAPAAAAGAAQVVAPAAGDARYEQLGRLFAEFLERGSRIFSGEAGPAAAAEPVVVSGASLGLPGGERVFSADAVRRILDGEQLIDVIPSRHRHAILDKHITRLVKTGGGDPHFESIDRPGDVIKLAGRAAAFDLEEEFGVPGERVAAFDVVTRLAVAAGIEALHDAGIPLVMHYRTTRKGTRIPERWMLPESLRDETGVIFASAFPGADSLVDEVTRYHQDRARAEQIEDLHALRARAEGEGASAVLREEIERRIHELEQAREQTPHRFDRRFLFRVLAMGHSQFAEYVGARGPNTQLNSACASTTQAFSLAEDWIRAGRCRRVVVVAADDVTTDHLLEWIGAGFLSTGAAAIDGVVEDAALPFDRRRHGMILGMGAAGFVIERPEAARERGLRPICEVLSTVTANSAFHGTRLDVVHIAGAMEQLVAQAERRFGLDRRAIAPELLFVSHETYTPARGGSASAEVNALRSVFGDAADSIVVANTKGLTGHAMGVGIEDAVAVKALETGVVPAVPNFAEPDPELGPLNLSKGGVYPIRYALRLGAGFGSQVSFSLLRWVASADGHRPHPDALGYATRVVDPGAWRAWLERVTGDSNPALEVVKRTLRAVDRGRAARPAAGPPAAAEAVARPLAAPAPVAEPALPAPAPVPEPLAAASAPAASDALAERVLAIVSEKTGYPGDMLELDLDLEADLGIDTVKQAETFAAIREAYEIPRDENLKLRDYPTLEHVIAFVRERRPDLVAAAPAAAPAAQPGPAPSAPAGADAVAERVLAIVSEKTGYPGDMLELDLDLEADLGIDTVKQAETFAAIREAYEIPRDENLKLRDYPTLEHVIAFVRERRPDLVAAAPAAAPAAQPGPAPSAPAGSDAVAERVLAIVSEKTGYPGDMLELDLDLEADLGIDTVKQAETFAAIREAYEIPRDENLKLRDYPTLEHVIAFVRERRPDLVAAAPAAAPAAASQPAAPSAAPESTLLRGDDAAAAAVPRRVPVPVLRPALELCVETGVGLDEGARVAVMPDRGGVAQALVRRLEKRGVEVLDLGEAGEELAERLAQWSQRGPVRGLYWLPALDSEPALGDLDLAQWRAALALRVKGLYAAARALGDALGGAGSFLVVGTRLGGQHGADEAGASAPLGGGVTGFAKAYKREQPECLVKAVDFAESRKTAELADALVEEVLRDPGCVEVGRAEGERWSLALEERALPAEAGAALAPGSVFVVTGAAGGIVSAITADLAAAGGGVFHLLDLVPAPDPADPDVALFRSSREALQRELAERLRGRGERGTPVQVAREMGAVERAHSALAALDAVRAAGGEAVWHGVDLTDGEAVAKVVSEVLARHGKVDVLVHAAGLERSHGLQDKPPEEFDLVFDVKADGWFNLLHALGDAPLGATVCFSSIAGRFGNAGQTDYSAANDLLCKLTSNLRRTRPDTRGVAIDWTAWGGLGMATRGSIPQLMERAGIDMLPASAGIPIVRRELAAGSPDREVVVAGALGVLLQEWEERGGLDPAALAGRASGPMLGGDVAFTQHAGLRVRTRLEPLAQPFLDHHRIDGTPVLPGVMGLEGFAELARLLQPERHVVALEDAAFLAPFKFYRDEPREVELCARFGAHEGGASADCALIGRRALAGRDTPQETVHFRARARLADAAPAEATAGVPAAPGGKVVDAADVYRVYFHGPAYQVLEAAWREDGKAVGRLADPLPANHSPAELPLVAAPRLVELCFQTAGIFEIGATGRLGLPRAIARLELFPAAAAPAGPVHAVVTPAATGFDAVVVDAGGRVCVRLEGYETAALPDPLDAERIAPLRAVFG